MVVNTTPVFARNLAAYKAGYPIICNEGGSRSSKSYSIIQLLIGLATQKRLRISVVSHSLPHIKRGVFRDFKEIMMKIGKWNEEAWRATDFVYHFKNGSYIELFGLEDEGKARGPGRDILFVNEANLISKPLFDQLAMRTTGQIFLDWNPADFNSWVYDVADNPKNKRIHSTYKDNIHNLSKPQIEYIEHYKTLPDDFMWKVYGLGERGAAKELIYTNWGYYEADAPGDVFYGLDFGYTNPTALIKVTHYEGSNYAEEMLYQSSLTVPELINHLKQIVKSDAPIYCDAAEPKTIEEIYKAGFNAIPSDKDVWAGIVGVKSYPLFIRHGSQNLIREIQGYKWKKDKNDNVLEEPVKANDHACFIGETMIETHAGLKRIDCMQKGDLVKTSQGYQQVLNVFDNGVKLTVEYRMLFDTFSVSLRCTPDHLIKTESGWKQISELKSGQTIFLSNFSMEGLTEFIQESDISNVTNGTCTMTFGDSIKDQFQEDFMCTTWMETHGTTTSKTLNSRKPIHTYQNIQENDLRTTQNGQQTFSEEELKLLLNGTKAKKGSSGIKSMQKEWDLVNHATSKKSVHNAERNSLISLQQGMQNSVMLTARLKHLEQGTKQPVRVYDLEVENEHEYFANGVLVHNCDAMRYAIFTHLTQAQTEWWGVDSQGNVIQ